MREPWQQDDDGYGDDDEALEQNLSAMADEYRRHDRMVTQVFGDGTVLRGQARGQAMYLASEILAMTKTERRRALPVWRLRATEAARALEQLQGAIHALSTTLRSLDRHDPTGSLGGKYNRFERRWLEKLEPNVHARLRKAETTLLGAEEVFRAQLALLEYQIGADDLEEIVG